MRTDAVKNADGTFTLNMRVNADELEELIQALPAEIPLRDPFGPEPVSLFRGTRYCVKVYEGTDQRSRMICQRYIYDSPLWSTIRAAAIMVRNGGGYAQESPGPCEQVP